MSELSSEDTLRIVCKCLNPFCAVPLLQGNGEPVAGAAQIQINNTLAELHANDQANGEHAIGTILNCIVGRCHDAGFDITLGAGQLALGAFVTIGDLVTAICNSADSLTGEG